MTSDVWTNFVQTSDFTAKALMISNSLYDRNERKPHLPLLQSHAHLLMSNQGFWQKVETPVRLIIVAKNKNCQAYLVCSLFFHPLRCPVDLASSSSWLEVTWPILFSRVREHSLSAALRAPSMRVQSQSHVTCWANQDEDDAKSTGQRRG